MRVGLYVALELGQLAIVVFSPLLALAQLRSAFFRCNVIAGGS
jgi:hypothetical protein